MSDILLSPYAITLYKIGAMVGALMGGGGPSGSRHVTASARSQFSVRISKVMRAITIGSAPV